MANSTPDTPDVSETKLAALKMDQLRAHARRLGIDGADQLHKPELLAKVKDYHYAQAHGGKHRDGSGAGSSTDGRPSASELSSMKLGELREHARKHGIDGADELHKPELLAKVKDYHYAQAHGGKHRPDTGSGSTGGAGGPSTVNEDRGGHSTPDTPEANKTALSTASTDTPQDRPSSPALPSPALHSPD